eukprot:Awhi_evm1s14056
MFNCVYSWKIGNTLTSDTSTSTPVAACRVEAGTPCASDVEIQPGTEGSVSLECGGITYDVCGWVSRNNENCDDVPICAPVVTACRVESGTPCASDVEIQPRTEGSVSLECSDATYDVCGWVSRSNQNCDDVPIYAPVVTACRVESGFLVQAIDVEIQLGVKPVSLECGDATYDVCGWVSRSNQNCDDVPICTSDREDVVVQNNGADSNSVTYQPSILICIAVLFARQFL